VPVPLPALLARSIRLCIKLEQIVHDLLVIAVALIAVLYIFVNDFIGQKRQAALVSDLTWFWFVNSSVSAGKTIAAVLTAIVTGLLYIFIYEYVNKYMLIMMAHLFNSVLGFFLLYFWQRTTESSAKLWGYPCSGESSINTMRHVCIV